MLRKIKLINTIVPTKIATWNISIVFIKLIIHILLFTGGLSRAARTKILFSKAFKRDHRRKFARAPKLPKGSRLAGLQRSPLRICQRQLSQHRHRVDTRPTGAALVHKKSQVRNAQKEHARIDVGEHVRIAVPR